MIDLDAVGYGNGLIYVGIPRERVYIPQFVDIRDALLTKMAQEGVACGYWQSEGHRVDRNRDKIVEAFLHHEKKPEWLFMMDSDMDHPVDSPMRLAKWKKPIVGALYFHRGEAHDAFCFDYSGMRKDQWGRDTHSWTSKNELVYEFLEENAVPMRDGGLIINNPVRNPLLECDAVATGCILIHRSVFEQMPAPWFEYRPGGNSEDLVFCKEAKDAGIPVYCDLSTICGHFHWASLGQAQFRMKYISRGINYTAYTKGIAARWWMKMFGGTSEEAMKKIEEGNAHTVGPLWDKRFGKKQPSQEEVDEFYRDPEVGKAYAMELLWWNFEVPFNSLRKTLTPLREVSVLEIGAGIGSVALQLWLQGCDVIASEINPILRDFADMRYQEMAPDFTQGVGRLSIVDETWVDKTEDESQDFVVSFDTFEHLAPEVLPKIIQAARNKLKMGGRLIYHANFKQQDIYPMHFDYSDHFEGMLTGFERISEMELKKVPL